MDYKTRDEPRLMTSPYPPQSLGRSSVNWRGKEWKPDLLWIWSSRSVLRLDKKILQLLNFLSCSYYRSLNGARGTYALKCIKSVKGYSIHE